MNTKIKLDQLITMIEVFHFRLLQYVKPLMPQNPDVIELVHMLEKIKVIALQHRKNFKELDVTQLDTWVNDLIVSLEAVRGEYNESLHCLGATVKL
jgi:hypothetical protein